MAKQVGKERGPFEAKNWFVKLKKENQKGETLKRFVLETAQARLAKVDRQIVRELPK